MRDLEKLDDEAFCKLFAEAIKYSVRTGHKIFAGMSMSLIFEEYDERAERVRLLLAIEKEREACAKIADGPWRDGDVGYMPRVALPIAAAIRERANIGDV